jgi:hypothetical protein
VSQFARGARQTALWDALAAHLAVIAEIRRGAREHGRLAPADIQEKIRDLRQALNDAGVPRGALDVIPGLEDEET